MEHENNKKITMSVDDMAICLGIGRSKAYKLVQEGIVPAFRIGRRILIPVKMLEEWIVQEAFPFSRKQSIKNEVDMLPNDNLPLSYFRG